MRNVEEKIEENAAGRARSQKIKNKDSYKGFPPGRLNLSVNYSNGCLSVYLDSARDLAGKRSQDPYAWCYLLGKDGRCYFQIGHNKTKCFDKNLNPDFHERFEFRLPVEEIITKSLVISIWDEDSKSRDDYMAGFRLSLEHVQYFQTRAVVSIELQHQDNDGHPAAMAAVDARAIFNIVLGSWDLKTCNNHLVAFIDRARVLAEAYEIKGSLPTTLHEKTAMMPPDASRLFEEEILRLKSLISKRRSKIQEYRSQRDILKNENAHLNATYVQSQHTLAERQSTLFSLESREAELSGKVIGLDHLRETIRILELRISAERERVGGRVEWHDVGYTEVIRVQDYNMNSIDMGRGQYEEEKRKIEIRIRNEFLLKMKAALEKARQSYHMKYQEFILKIERDADEIIRLYEDIIRERTLKSSDRRNQLLDLERKRAYQLRIDQLLADIDGLRSRIGPLEGKIGGLDAEYRGKLADLDAALNALKQKLRDLFGMFAAFAQSRYNETNEISIYNYLLGFEEGRLSDALHRVQRKVTVSERVERTSHAAGMSVGGGMSSSFSHGYSVKSGSGGYKRESGYSSPANTPSSVHGGGMATFEFPESASYGEHTVTRSSSRSSRSSYAGHGDGMTTARSSSRHSTGTVIGGGGDNVFHDIKGDIMNL